MKSTSITKTSAYPYAESAGAPSRKRTLNGKKLWHQSCQCKIENNISLTSETRITLS